MALTASVYFGSSGLAAAPLDMSPPPPPPPSAPTGTGDAAARSITAMMTKSAERRSVSSMASPPLILNRRVESAVPLNSAPDCEDPEGWSMLLRRRRHFIRPRSEDTMADPVTWPDGARCAIMMTFDLDGESPWIHRDAALADRPLHMSMGAYGPKTGMPRILDLLDRYGIRTCIFIPGWIVERYPALCEDIVRRGHEVGHHGYLHEKPFFLRSREEEEEWLVKSLDISKKILGVKPLGSRSPSADPSRLTMELLRQHGFVYHSNALDTDLPYCHQTKHGPLVEFPTAWCNNDAPFFMWSSVPPVGNGIWSQQDVWEIWSEEFEGLYAEGGFFNWLAHPQIIGRPSRLRMVERLIQLILGKRQGWWARPVRAQPGLAGRRV